MYKTIFYIVQVHINNTFVWLLHNIITTHIKYTESSSSCA